MAGYSPWRPMSERRVRGFTLIEVLVALAVLAVALSAIMRAVAQAADLAHDLRDRTYALWIAQDHVTRARLERAWPAPDTREGALQFVGRDWNYREVVAPTQVGDMRRMEVEVRASGGEQVLGHVVGFLVRP